MTTPVGADQPAARDPSAPPSPPAARAASIVEDFIDVFYAPSAVYARRENSSYWAHFWIVSLVAAGLLFASRGIIGAVFDAEFARESARAIREDPRITEEILQQQRALMEGISTVGVYLATPLVIVAGAILIYLGARFVSARVSFSRAMLISAIAQIPRLLGAFLLAVEGILMEDTSSITGEHSVSYGPARFMDPDAMPPEVLGVIGRLDVFTVWTTVVMGIGVAVIARVSRGRGLAAAAVAWGLASAITLLPLAWS